MAKLLPGAMCKNAEALSPCSLAAAQCSDDPGLVISVMFYATVYGALMGNFFNSCMLFTV